MTALMLPGRAADVKFDLVEIIRTAIICTTQREDGLAMTKRGSLVARQSAK